MTKRFFFSRRVCRLAAASLPLLSVSLPGCAPISVDVVQEFVTDLARNAPAAWLL